MGPPAAALNAAAAAKTLRRGVDTSASGFGGYRYNPHSRQVAVCQRREARNTHRVHTGSLPAGDRGWCHEAAGRRTRSGGSRLPRRPIRTTRRAIQRLEQLRTRGEVSTRKKEVERQTDDRPVSAPDITMHVVVRHARAYARRDRDNTGRYSTHRGAQRMRPCLRMSSLRSSCGLAGETVEEDGWLTRGRWVADGRR